MRDYSSQIETARTVPKDARYFLRTNNKSSLLYPKRAGYSLMFVRSYVNYTYDPNYL